MQYSSTAQLQEGEGNALDLNVPQTLAGHLQRISIFIPCFFPIEYHESENISVDLAGFAECQFLEGIEVNDVGGGEAVRFRGDFKVFGLGGLPAACKSVVLVPRPNGARFFVEPESGWHIDVDGGRGGRIFVRRAEV